MQAQPSRPRNLWQRIGDLPLRVKFTVTFFAATVVTVGVLLYIAAQVVIQQNLNDEGHDLQLHARGAALSLGEMLNGQIDKVQSLTFSQPLQDHIAAANALYPSTESEADRAARLNRLAETWRAASADDPFVTDRLANPIAEDLREFSARFVTPLQLTLTDRYGVLIAATHRTPDLVLAQTKWWQEAYNGGAGAISISQPYADGHSGGLALQLAVPVRAHMSQEVVGVLGATYALTHYTDLIGRTRFGETGRGYLLLSHRQIMDGAGEMLTLPPQTLADLDDLVRDTAAEFGRFPFLRVDSLVSHAPVTSVEQTTSAIDDLNWRVIMVRDFADAYADSQQAAQVMSPMVVLAALGSGVVAFIVAVVVTRPIRHLTRVTQAVAAGDLSQRAQHPRRDELGLLAENFNQMADAVQRRERELADERALLTQRVADRTAELRDANDQLARAARLKDEFLANMSHELRTPLNAILGLTEVLRAGEQGALNAEQQHSLRIIDDSGRHLLALINDILDLSKIEAGRLQLQTDLVAVDAICASSVQFIRAAAARKQLTVEYHNHAGDATLSADARRLKQILVNLLSNAVKFTPDGGRVGLHVATGPGAVTFTVWDTGIGIRPDDLPLLFKPFAQIDSSLARQYEGSGLGLALVARLTELHNGTVRVHSEPGRGSEFSVTIPWTGTRETDEMPPPTDEAAAGSLPPAPIGDLRPLILVADDSDESAEMFELFLRRHGYRVAVARNGEEALRAAQTDRPALMIMDLQMPELDGLEVIRRVRATPDLVKVPILVVTAHAMTGVRERCLEVGANAYLSKPLNLRDLGRAVEEQLRMP